jgi:hypothetical protein
VTCNEIQNMTVPYLELDLDPERVHQMTTHLEACLACRSEMESVRQVLVRLKGRLVPDPGEPFWREFPDRVRVRLLHARADTKEPSSHAQHVFARVSLPRWSWALAASVSLLLGGWLLIGGQFFGTSPGNVLTRGGDAPKIEATNNGPGPDLSDVAEVDWERTWDDDDQDMVLVDMAARLDPRILDRLFKDI